MPHAFTTTRLAVDYLPKLLQLTQVRQARSMAHMLEILIDEEIKRQRRRPVLTQHPRLES